MSWSKGPALRGWPFSFRLAEYRHLGLEEENKGEENKGKTKGENKGDSVN